MFQSIWTFALWPEPGLLPLCCTTVLYSYEYNKCTSPWIFEATDELTCDSRF